MLKVVITGLKMRKMAKDYKNVAPIHKPSSKPGIAKANIKKATVSK